VSPAAATVLTLIKGAQTTLFVETGSEGLWTAAWNPGAGPLAWTQVAPPAGLPGGVAREVAYVAGPDALFLSGLGTLSRLDRPDRCLTEVCPLTPVSVPVVGAAGWTPLTTAYGNVPLAAEGSTLFVVAGADPNTDKPGTVFRFNSSASGAAAWTRMPDPDAVAANQLIRPIAVTAESGRLAITTSGNGLVVYD